MTIARHIARPMLASIFITGGIDALRDPGAKADMAGDVATATAEALPLDLPDDPAALVRIDAVAKITGGLLLAGGGRTARIGAVICAASLVPTTVAGHPFWSETDPEKRAKQQIDFTKNVSLLGGLLIAALDSGGRPSVPWRAKRQARKVQARAARISHRSHDSGHHLATAASAGASQLADRVSDLDLPARAGHAMDHLADRVSDLDVPARASDVAGRVADRVSDLDAPARLGHVAGHLADRASDIDLPKRLRR